MRWVKWEQPWTRGGGHVSGYQRMTRVPRPGDVVALRQPSRPYLPTFAPWWIGLTVESVGIEGVTFVGKTLVARLDQYPVTTHWALLTEASS